MSRIIKIFHILGKMCGRVHKYVPTLGDILYVLGYWLVVKAPLLSYPVLFYFSFSFPMSRLFSSHLSCPRMSSQILVPVIFTLFLPPLVSPLDLYSSSSFVSSVSPFLSFHLSSHFPHLSSVLLFTISGLSTLHSSVYFSHCLPCLSISPYLL